MKPKEKMDLNKLYKKIRANAGRAVCDYSMIEDGDKVMAAISGGKDSFVMLDTLLYLKSCLLYTSPSPRDKRQSRMPSSA